MHTRGRYSPLTDGFTHAKSYNKDIQCTLEADTAHSQMGSLMHAKSYNKDIQCTHEVEWQYIIKLMAYTTHSKVGSQYVEYVKIQTTYSAMYSITLMGSTKKMS